MAKRVLDSSELSFNKDAFNHFNYFLKKAAQSLVICKGGNVSTCTSISLSLILIGSQ